MNRAALFDGLLDDAAVYPPGSLPLAQAVPAHLEHIAAGHRSTVGPFVLGVRELPELAELTAHLQPGTFELSAISPLEQLDETVRLVAATPAWRLVALEVTVSAGMAADEAVQRVRHVAPAGVTVFVEIPRDERRDELIAALAGTGIAAKLRTGGVRADLYPDEDELAAAIIALVSQGVPFKATAGLHHAVRNTDPETGFEQHGFLNLMLATARARSGAGLAEVREALALRDGQQLASQLPGAAGIRDSFVSFGTCSIQEPVDELVGLGLLPAGYAMGAR